MARTRNLGNLTDLLTANTGTGLVTATDPGQFDRTGALATTNWVKNSGKRYASIYQISNTGGTTLTAANSAGKLVDFASSYTGTATLPSSATFDDGETITLWSGAATAFNLVCAGTDTIFVYGATVTSIPFNNGDTLELTKFASLGGQGAWVATGGSLQLKYSTGVFGSTVANNGYQKLPSGLIIQWGSSGNINVTGGAAPTTNTITFPIAFPNARLNIVGAANIGITSAAFSFTMEGGLSASFVLRIYSAATSTMNINYVAIGF